MVGSTVLGMTMMFLGVLLFSRYRFPSMLIAVLVGILLVRIVAAIDTVSLTPQKHSWKMFVLAWATLLSSAGLFDFLVTPYYIAHFVQAFSVPASSMEPTLLVGDRILSDNSFYDSRPPQQGDIVVFRYPLDPATYFVKRVIGVPGDRIRIEGSLLYRNGVALDEPYAAYKSLRPRNERDNFPILPSPTAFSGMG